MSTYHGRKLRIGVVSRSDFNDICSGQVDALKATDDRADLASRPSAGLRRTRGRSESRVDGVDVDRKIDRRVLALGTNVSNAGYTQATIPSERLTNAVVDLLNNSGGANGVNLPGLYNLKSDISVVVVVRQTTQRRADTRVNVGVVLQKALHRGMVEVRSMVDACDFAWSAAEDLGLPGVEVRVEVDHSDRAVGFVHAAKDGEGDGVVAAHGDDTREGLALLCESGLFGVGGRLAHEDAVVAFFDLVDGPVWVVPSYGQAVALLSSGSGCLRCNRHITAVNYGRPRIERVRGERHVVASTVQLIRYSRNARTPIGISLAY